MYAIPSIGRAIKVIEEISKTKRGLTAVQLEKQLGIPKSTLYRILYTLDQMEVVSKQKRQFQIGLRSIQLALNLMANVDFRYRAIPYLERLSKETRETSHLAVPYNKHSLIIEVREGSNPISIPSRPGSLISQYNSSHGKVFLAFRIDPNELGDYLADVKLKKKTTNTIVDINQLKEDMESLTSIYPNISKIHKHEHHTNDLECEFKH